MSKVSSKNKLDLSVLQAESSSKHKIPMDKSSALYNSDSDIVLTEDYQNSIKTISEENDSDYSHLENVDTDIYQYI